ncbi:chromosome segregation protein SMC [Lachnoclostridium sp. An196]|uniref:chromosome segregation protein SMC n=1 Tax=Lachnoclostridium sp. An196 TaxID=1965583 RepID=UPI000B39E66C|nr:chromosome segregation protein SMC [Lachnoclostridium sp. An196]OUP19872.1 chromosome segregation protein SMC [Lachnoclostridium sp. An196]
MYLKSIEVQGFKSFANKIVFDFHNGITGIVGPNGSGKSNVADAVRWVLGEQRVKQLRGGTMQDVIFSGTENRKPLSYAFVSITLDNADHQLPVAYEEVTVARRLYRSGESEYLLNGSVCRLKDVQELFYDTGIGKEGYSLIGQGQIDRILSTKPEESRELFDEATGIVKFKKRKKTAEKKLEDEHQNLLRVSDILSELEKQLGPLERQAEKAREYLKKRETLKKYEVQAFLMEMESIRSQVQKLEAAETTARNDLAETTQAFENTRIEYDRIEKELEGVEHRIDAAKEEASAARVEKQQLKGQIAVLKEQMKSAQSSGKHFRERMEGIEADLAGRREEKERTLAEKEDLDLQLSQAQKIQKEAEETLAAIQQRLSDCQTNIENSKNEIISVLNQRSSIKGKIQRYDAMAEQIQIRKAEVDQKLIKMKSEEMGQEELLSEEREKLRVIQQELKEKNEERAGIEGQIAELQQQITICRKRVEDGQTVYHREASRLESLQNLAERYDGYGGSIRRVMEQREKVPGICGVVADLIQTEQKYETAVETALGGSIQNVVTEDEETAKQMIRFLKQNRYGRVTFLPLTAVKHPPSFGQPQALKEEGVIGLAHTLVRSEERYQNILAQLLGRTVVVEHIDHAVALQRKYRYSLRIVTLEGESLNPGGSMTGGSFRSNSSLLSRNREIEELKGKAERLKRELEDTRKKLVELQNERSRCYSILDQGAAQLQEIRVKENTARMNVEQLEEQKRSSGAGMEQLQKESLELERQSGEIRELKEANRKELKDSEDMEKAHTFAVETYQKRLEEEQSREEEASKLVETYHLDTASLLQKAEFNRAGLERIEGELEKLLHEKEELSRNVQQAEEDTKSREEGASALQERMNEIDERISALEEKTVQLQKEKEEQTASHKSFFGKREELSARMNNLDKELFRIGSQKEKLDENSETLMNHMWEEYELTYNAALPLRDTAYASLSELKKNCGTVKEEIKELGNVNVNAIDDYKEVSERFAFMDGQKNDLQEAEAALKNVIQELDGGMKKQFREQFQLIQKEFDKAFKELFGGGRGTLELIDEEDVLESGIRIISQPPGKKLQNMMQLSGGEKALTAIALLFAIQNLKPSPFCLLDEIEAALDDSNVVRFAKYLHKLTEHTQFIVITHRRGTMNAADRLYGITMQEKGVSTLVSVSLIENDLDK